MRMLFQNGLSMAASNDIGYGTSIHAAASKRHVEVVRLLVENGVNVNATASYGKPALQGAAMNRDLAVINLLLRSKVLVKTNRALTSAPQSGESPKPSP